MYVGMKFLVSLLNYEKSIKGFVRSFSNVISEVECYPSNLPLYNRSLRFLVLFAE